MLKQILVIFILSVLAIMFARQFGQILYALSHLHQLLVHSMQEVFAGSRLGYILSRVLALLVPAFLVAAIIELVMRLLRQASTTRYAMYGMWGTWLLLLALTGIR